MSRKEQADVTLRARGLARNERQQTKSIKSMRIEKENNLKTDIKTAFWSFPYFLPYASIL